MTHEIVEEIFPLGAALYARGRALSAIIQEHRKAPGGSGDLPNVNSEPGHVAEERRDPGYCSAQQRALSLCV